MRIWNLLSCTSATLALLLISGGAFCATAESKPVADKTPDHRHSVDLRPILQKWKLDARSQGGRGTCSVFAMNAALEFAVATKQRRGTRLSVEFLNWASNEAVGAAVDGGCFSELWAGYAAHGVCPEADMPYADSFDPARKPDKKARRRCRENSRSRSANPLDQAMGSNSGSQRRATRRNQADA